ncbi:MULTISPECIES: hypothetical protein [Novosphingobium]|uniref:hypothetical protein n=1 Tax=Novosphingobium TaxID=165696 RepID=UPI0022F299AA|nr:hypothetical protein [Novosphingobium resinovorum]GLK44983.1 hypothetical protein GCM10017612_29030 [Novosphingobium resinovorum]
MLFVLAGIAIYFYDILSPGQTVNQTDRAAPDVAYTLPTEFDGSAAPVEAPAAASDPQPGATLDWAFREGVIGLNPSFVESKLGPAKSKTSTDWTFEVQGCNVSYGIKGSEITSVSTFVKKGCLPKVGSRTITSETTFAQLGAASGIIRTSCLWSCGNSYDPTIDLFQNGYHANNFIDVLYQSRFGDAQDRASELWQQSIRVAHGIGPEDYDGQDSDWFQCVAGPPAPVLTAIGPEHVGYITMGRDLGQDGCRY